MFLVPPLVPLLGAAIITYLVPNAYASRGFDPCPAPCFASGFNPANWTAYSSLSRLRQCDKAVMIDFSIYAPPEESQRFRSCAIWGADFENIARATSTPKNLTQVYTTTQSADLELAWWNSTDGPVPRSDTIDAILTIDEVKSYLIYTDRGSNDRIILFAASGNAAVGVYVGAAVISRDIPSAVVQPLIDQVLPDSLSKTALAQVCGANRTNQDTVGIIAATNGDFTPVQAALRTWSKAKCVEGADGALRVPNTTITIAYTRSNSTTHVNGAYEVTRLHKRGDCRTLSVNPGDTCYKLADRCGISLDQFEKYNLGDGFCAGLQPNQKVCCTSGTIPTPKTNGDGSCASYKVASGDTCSSLALSNGITEDDIEKFNKDTWGWGGCDPSNFWANTIICLSSGTPPMPAALDTANCGPQVPGTRRPPAGTSLASLNPCPLNVCCDIWGQCGTTDEFCDIDGPNKCISNCGKDIIKSSAPSSQMTIAYFEGFNLQRDCLNMDISQVDTKAYTHIHFAFGIITSDFKVSLGEIDVEYEFGQFRQITGPKKILSFGGWDFSTNPNTYTIFRDGTSDAHRETLAENMANFIKSNNMDGVDIDWEYPSAPDIPGIPPGDKAEGNNLLEFLKLLKSKLPGKSVSIAAPASYWYLKGIPIREISKVVDYIVYMTYDLHGQWDYGNQWSDPGCPSGNCLRSDVNITETLNALVMITKAGVPANKVVIGVTSYGRSFKMTTPGCTGESCTYTGSASGATPGRCTKQAGYLGGAEIDEILSNNPTASTSFDIGSQTDILTYDKDWVSYMTKGTKESRTRKYKAYNFLGSSDWAVDLADFHEPPDISGTNGASSGVELSWDTFKANLENTGIGTCDLAYRTGTWVSKPCTIDVVSSIYMFLPRERWDRMDCDHAWKDAMTRWFNCDQIVGNTSFSQSVSNFAHSTGGAKCEDLSTYTNCDSIDKCYAHNTADDTADAKTGACGYEVWNSIIAIHQVIKNFVDTAQVAREGVLERTDAFLTDFGNPSGGDLGPLFQALNPIIGLLGGWFFKGALATMPAFKGSDDYLSSSAVTALGIFLGFVPGLLPKREDLNEAALADYIDATFDTWYKSANAFDKYLFTGTEAAIDDLTSLVANGSMIDGSMNGHYDPDENGDYVESFINEGLAEKAFFGVSVPIIWSVMGNNPVVLMTDYDCGTDNPLSPQYMDESDGPSTWVCMPGENKIYYLVEAYGDKEEDCMDRLYENNNVGCVDRKFRGPRGIGKLDGQTWAGLTRDDIVVGAYHTYKANGRQNKNEGGIDFTDETSLGSIVDNDIRAPGMINLPVCTAKEAFANWVKGRKDSKAKFYPCN